MDQNIPKRNLKKRLKAAKLHDYNQKTEHNFSMMELTVELSSFPKPWEHSILRHREDKIALHTETKLT